MNFNLKNALRIIKMLLKNLFKSKISIIRVNSHWRFLKSNISGFQVILKFLLIFIMKFH